MAKPVRVLVAGTFDGIHAGHLHLLSFARKKASALEKELGRKGVALQVIVARDSSVKRIKGKAPLHNESERKLLVESLKPVDKAVLGHPADFFSSVAKLKPDLIVLGYDQAPGVERQLEKRGFHRLARASAYAPSRLKSSHLKRNKFSKTF